MSHANPEFTPGGGLDVDAGETPGWSEAVGFRSQAFESNPSADLTPSMVRVPTKAALRVLGRGEVGECPRLRSRDPPESVLSAAEYWSGL